MMAPEDNHGNEQFAAQRAEWRAKPGAVTLRAYMQNRSYLRAGEMSIALEHLLADLMHLADAQGVDFEDCLCMARLRHDDDLGDYPYA